MVRARMRRAEKRSIYAFTGTMFDTVCDIILCVIICIG